MELVNNRGLGGSVGYVVHKTSSASLLRGGACERSGRWVVSSSHLSRRRGPGAKGGRWRVAVVDATGPQDAS